MKKGGGGTPGLRDPVDVTLAGECRSVLRHRYQNNALGQIKCEQIAAEGNPEFGADLQQTSTLPPAAGAAVTK